MGRNVKPILSVLIDEDKRDRFRRLADDTKLSMGWLLNDAIDRMLEANSIDIYKTSIGDTDTSPKSERVAVSQSSIEEMVKTYVDSCLQNISIGNTDTKDIEEMVKTYVDETVKESIGTAIEPIERLCDEIEEQIKELETFTRSQLEAMRGELKKSECDRVDGGEGSKERKPKSKLDAITDDDWQFLSRENAMGTRSLADCAAWISEKYGLNPDPSTIQRRFKKLSPNFP